MTGDGVKQDREKAKELFLLASDKQVPESYYQLSLLFEEDGEMDKAEMCLVRAARTDVPIAQYNLAMAYYWEKITPKNPKITKESETAKWILKAAKRMKEGKLVAGYLYYKGLGVVRNEEKSFQWFEEAHQEGEYFSSFITAYYYATGIGVPDGKNINTARDIINKLSKNGSILASSLRYSNDDKLMDELTEIAINSLDRFNMENVTSPEIYEPKIQKLKFPSKFPKNPTSKRTNQTATPSFSFVSKKT